MKISKQVSSTAVVFAGVGALNVGLSKFLSFNLLSFVPAGMVSTLVYAVVGLSGAVVLYQLYDKKL